MMPTVYSVAIRSVKDNQFLRRTLDSLQKQTILPDEIVIVIPTKVPEWNTGVASVRFVQAERGMVTQRATGIQAAKNKYLLLLDDDVVLSPNMAEVLLMTMRERNADCIVPYWDEGWPKKKFTKAFMSFWRLAIPQKTGGIRYAAGGGYFYPRQEPTTPWETHGGSGAVILVNREFCIENDCLGDEALQEVSVYALRDDGAFILDISRKGGLCLMVGGISFIHLGGTTRLDPSRLEMSFKAQIYNHYLFWKTYIKPSYSKTVSGKFISWLSIIWYLVGSTVLGLLAASRARSIKPIRGIISGLRLLSAKSLNG
jgi:glycosyltransferase involved in cell wall biosynthesis